MTGSTVGKAPKRIGERRKIAGVALLVLTLVSSCYGALGLDPNSKMSDDSDPLGPEPSAAEKAVPFEVAGISLLLGGILIVSGNRASRRSGSSGKL